MTNEVRLIDANAYYRLYCSLYEGNVPDGEMDRMAFVVQRIPTIDPESLRPNGRWEEADDGDGVVCSVCREDFCTIIHETERFKYCPNCGVKME